jgi:hypothetical protein
MEASYSLAADGPSAGFAFYGTPKLTTRTSLRTIQLNRIHNLTLHYIKI